MTLNFWRVVEVKEHVRSYVDGRSFVDSVTVAYRDSLEGDEYRKGFEVECGTGQDFQPPKQGTHKELNTLAKAFIQSRK